MAEKITEYTESARPDHDLTGLADAALDAIRKHPGWQPGMRAIVMVTGEDGTGVGTTGYAKGPYGNAAIALEMAVTGKRILHGS